MGIFSQLGDLFLAAVPTVIIVFLLFFFLRWSFFNPIERVLSERHRRAAGAQREAEVSRVAAQEKLRAYNDASKKARTEVFGEQEATRRVVLEKRQAAIGAARQAAQSDLQASKKALAAEVESVRTQLDQATDTLASEIVGGILAGAHSGSGPGSGESR